ncbi:class I SAM-dependent methyltransferase [Caldibacillus lycopersici]|uniref:Class I SAM-dependent methyltransferase n=1 Tax=Perspicuibacillus lycopersici TaxID=1325689 RepID=A0AAE3IRW6_9BACI|nr:class I SAM-dependent methyltransferase [Perspicuibacillus lycopersici]MCU9613082.1 class I SAM-dependent methyltransferase [Perspicuibacillus lycopersici]
MKKAKYGIDAPFVPVSYSIFILALFLIGFLFVSAGHQWAYNFFGYGLFCCVLLSIYMHTTLKGKYQIWNKVLSEWKLNQNAHFLDLGCGRGAIFYLIVKTLGKTVKGTGIDLWRKVDQSGNDRSIAMNNAAIEGVSNQIQLITGDMRSLPFQNNSFDFVTSNMAIHNIKQKMDRRKALKEAYRVLKSGGILIIVDISYGKEYKAVVEELGMVNVTLKNAGWQGWWSGPFVSTYILTATKC